MTHYRIDLDSLAVLDRDGAPPALLGLPNTVLANPGAFIDPCPPEFVGVGFWPVSHELPTFNPATQRLSQQADELLDADACAVTVRPLVVNLTPAEIEEHAAAAGAALKQQVADAVQRHLDEAVAVRNYSSAAAAVSYVGDPNPRWDAEGRAVRAWRSAVWTACFAALDDVLAGKREPLTPEQMVAELPPLVWL